jgi:hypothetical protein
VNWRESHVAGAFDLGTAPFALGLFLGDYQGLTSVGSTFMPFYVTTNADSAANLTDVFAALVTTLVPIPTALGTAAAGPALHAVAAPAVEIAPHLQQSLSDAARRTLQRRWIARVGAGVIPTPTNR